MISTIMYATTNTAAKTITTISPRSKLSWRSNSMVAGIPQAAFGPGQTPTHDSQARAGIASAGIMEAEEADRTRRDLGRDSGCALSLPGPGGIAHFFWTLSVPAD